MGMTSGKAFDCFCRAILLVTSLTNAAVTAASTSSTDNGVTSTEMMTQPTLQPSIGFTTHLALTTTATVIFSVVFICVYVQLWMILYYGHRRRSYQTVFLYLCLVWAALRLTLFTFYFNNDTIATANDFNPLLYWLLYSFPVVLQFMTLVVLVTFFSQVVIKARYPQNAKKYKFRVRVICAVSVVIFTIVNMVCGIIAQTYLEDPCHTSWIAVVVRVAINGFLFLAHGVALSYWIFSLNRVANARAILESRGTNLWQAWAMCIFIVFIYASRALYNAIALALPKIFPSFGYSWLNVTDQADLVDLSKGVSYAVYFAVLFIWEILPTVIVIGFFRVQKPSRIQETNFDDLSYRQQYFFDNPRRYDSDEDLSIKYGSQSSIGSINRQSGGAINSSPSSRDVSPRGTQSRDPRLVRLNSSQPYTEPAYDGT